MADDRRGPLVVGVLTVATGAVLFLAPGDVLHVPDATFGAPRWLAAVFALGIFFGGSYIVSAMLPTPWMRRLLGAASLLSFVTMGALLMTWQALTATGAGPLVSRDLPRLIVVGFFWIFALVLDAVALVAWIVALRMLLHRPPARYSRMLKSTRGGSP